MIDTNVLLRLFRPADPQNKLIKSALSDLNSQGIGLYFSLQNIAEFWNVCTRPTERNGFGLTIFETNSCAQEIERTMTFLPDSEDVYLSWRQLVTVHEVRGVQVHDARLVAIMQAYGLTRILTLNQSDFLRFTNIQAVHPNQLQFSA
ncbi:MAG: type II toxin-antitoxin system VapC family toxin [Terracidiphilus sp.]